MRKREQVDESWPVWFNGKKIDEVRFCEAFLEEHRGENGLVEASAVEQYDRMAADVKALGDEIKRLEEQADMDARLSAATSTPAPSCSSATT